MAYLTLQLVVKASVVSLQPVSIKRNRALPLTMLLRPFHQDLSESSWDNCPVFAMFGEVGRTNHPWDVKADDCRRDGERTHRKIARFGPIWRQTGETATSEKPSCFWVDRNILRRFRRGWAHNSSMGNHPPI